ncbi:hypothetical protein ACFLZ7_00040 [Nanoarchaeota archaeon]
MKDFLKKYFTFSAEEIKGMIISVLVIAFIFSFKEWGVDKFDFLYGLKNFINIVLIVALAFLVREVAHRFFAGKTGLRAEYRSWTFGLLIGVIIVVLSRGELIFLAPGGILVHHLAGARLGAFRYGLVYKTMGWVAAAGPLANIVLALFFKIMTLFPLNLVLIQKAISLNLWLAIFGMLPIPPLDGSKMFYASRFMYVWVIGLVAGAAFFINYTGVLTAIIGTLVVSLIILAMFAFTFEKPV